SHSSGLLVTPSTVLAISNSNYARQAKAMYSGLAAHMCFNPGASGDRSPARPQISPGRGARPTGNACRRGLEPKDRGCRGLLIRRNIADGDLAFFTTWCPAATPIETLVAVEGHRWAIEDSFETAKNEFGLDHNESRSWHGWHRHVSLVMLAFAMMAVIRHRANPPPPKKMKRRTTAKPEA